MTDETAMQRVVESWQCAAVDPTQWATALSGLATLMKAPSSLIFTPEPDAADRAVVIHSGPPDEAIRTYIEHWSREDPWFLAMAKKGVRHAAGTVEVGRAYVEPATLRRTGFYQDFARRYGVHDSLSLLLTDARDPAIPETRVTFHRPHGVSEFSEAELEFLRSLWLPLRRATQAYWLLRRGRDARADIDHALDALPHPLWVLGADARLEHANPAAVNLMRRGEAAGPVKLTRLGVLDAEVLHRAIARLVAGGSPMLVTALRLHGRPQRAAVHLSPLAGNPSYAARWPRAVALMMVDVPGPDRLDAWLGLFARLHRLTAAEAGVLALLVEGHGAPEVAQRLGVAYSTARTHVRMLLEKTGSRRQSDLIRRVLEG